MVPMDGRKGEGDSDRFMVPHAFAKSRGLSMNLLFGVPALAGPGRLKAGHRTDGTTQTGSWSRCTASKSWGLSMNPLEAQPVFGVGQSSGALTMEASQPKAPEDWRSPRRYRA